MPRNVTIDKDAAAAGREVPEDREKPVTQQKPEAQERKKERPSGDVGHQSRAEKPKAQHSGEGQQKNGQNQQKSGQKNGNQQNNGNQQKKPEGRPRELPAVPVGTLYFNRSAVEKLVKRRVAKTVAERMNAGYSVVKKSDLDELRMRAENAAAPGTAYLGNERSYRIMDMKTGSVVPLEEGETRVGIEDSFADLVITGSLAVSRRHAVITLSGGNLSVRDIGSTNHTFIDGVRIDNNIDVELVDGNVVTFADRKFTIQEV